MSSMRQVACAGLAFAIVATEPAAQVAEGPEPNRCPATATVPSCGAQGCGHLDAATLGGDVDSWLFSTTSAIELRAFVTGRRGGATSLTDARLVLLSGDGATVLATNSDYSGRAPDLVGAMPRIRIGALPAGTYLLVVAGQSVLDVGDYGIDLRCAPPSTGVGCSGGLLAEAELEPNDLPLPATLLVGDGVEPDSYLVRVRGSGASTGDYAPRIVATPVSGSPPVLASSQLEGQGCAGSGGVPLAIALRANGWPQFGTTWICEAVGLAPGKNGLFIGFLGLLPFPVPVDLGLLGAPGCTLAFPELVVVPFVPTLPTEAEFLIAIPDSLPQPGVAIFLRAIALDLPANDLGVTTSDVVRIRLGNDA